MRLALMEPFCWRRLRLFQPNMGVSPTTKATVQHTTTARPARRGVTTRLYLQTQQCVSALPPQPVSAGPFRRFFLIWGCSYRYDIMARSFSTAPRQHLLQPLPTHISRIQPECCFYASFVQHQILVSILPTSLCSQYKTSDTGQATKGS